ncbi:hypothetical protein FDECE_8431 [Fusarium decemcellulare]|nr:hypothetical protein FDECE_8431 [Fusarium decemcellulare]
MHYLKLLYATSAVGLSLAAGGMAEASHKPPNIVFILTDDQDLQMDSLSYMPLLDKYIRQKGTFYARHYCTTAICCPARASILTGKMAHNHNVTDTAAPFGGYPRVIAEGINDNYLPHWLQDAGYDTYYVGKLWNAHSIENYDKPYAKGWNGSDFLLDPYTYEFYNPTMSRNSGKPVAYNGSYSTDLIAEKSLGFIHEAVQGSRPFFLGIAPVAPHSDVHFTGEDDANGIPEVVTSPPFSAERHKDLFADVIVPRTPHFNPEKPSGVYWVRDLPRLNQTHIEFNDWYYRQRLRSLQSVDEMIEVLVQKLEEHGVLDNTYIVFTTDNGFHVGQHRLQPGKYCPFEEDVRIPLLIRGPGIAANERTEIVTTHTDLAPTFLSMAQGRLRGDFDGERIPLTMDGIVAAKGDRYEHVQVEYWGFALSESKYRYEGRRIPNNTYKALRVIGEHYNIYYSIWCNNEHELYDMKTDPYQLKNIYPSSDSENMDEKLSFLDRPISAVLDRLDALTMVLKTCRAAGCVKPWKLLHPNGKVSNLREAMHPKFDKFYKHNIPNVKYDHCAEGYFLELEGPRFDGSMSFMHST